MVSHVPFLDLNTVKKDKRMTISQFILCVLMFFMHFRLPIQNAFKNSCQYSTGTGQKQRLPFYDISLVVQKKSSDIMEQVDTRPRSRNTIISCWSCVRPNTYRRDSYVSVRLHCKSNATKWLFSLSLLHQWSQCYYISG